MKVLLATDGSPNAIEAARFLRGLQFGQTIDLTLLSVCYDPQSGGAELVQPWFPDWLEQQTRAFEAHHVELEKILEGSVQSVVKLQRNGHAARVVLDEAQTLGADLIVMGAQGHSMMGRMVLGSVSDNVATHATCSVLVVRPKTETPSIPSNIALAYDGSNASRHAVEELTAVQLSDSIRLTLISISPIYDYMMGDGLAAVAIENEQAVQESMKDTLDEVCLQIASTFPGAKGQVEKGRHVGDTIVEVIERDNSDMVVIGDSGHGLLHDWILGSTTKYVLRHAPCSVWISRHHRRDTESEK